MTGLPPARIDLFCRQRQKFSGAEAGIEHQQDDRSITDPAEVVIARRQQCGDLLHGECRDELLRQLRGVDLRHGGDVDLLVIYQVLEEHAQADVTMPGLCRRAPVPFM